jgi:hypothetical protein
MKDKILFWLGSDFTQFCVSYYLQKSHDADLYAIADITNKPKKFFQEQQLVNFKKVWYFHDHIKSNKKPDLEYLSSFEKKYNIDIWKLAINERIFYRFFNFHKFTSDEILSIDEHACRFFEQVLDEIKPDFFITKEPVFHHLELFYELCRARGVRPLVLSIPKIGFRCMISEESQKITTNKTLNDVTGKNRSFEELRSYLRTHDSSKQLKNYDTGKKFSDEIRFLMISDNKNIKTNYNYYGRTKIRVFFYTINSILKKKYREYFMKRNLATKVDCDTKFVYFPLGVDEGRELLIAAPFFTNQIEIIRHVAKSLPVGYKLYVKEHPSAIIQNWRNVSEYNEISSIPNVVLIYPTIKSEKLYHGCSLVISVSGSAGLEATFYQKPSVIFSDLAFSILPSVFRIRSMNNLSVVIRKALETKVDVSDLDKYLTLLEENSFDFDWFGLLVEIRKHFYFGGDSIDTEITQTQMVSFLHKNNDVLTKLTKEYLKKLNEFKTNTKQ